MFEPNRKDFKSSVLLASAILVVAGIASAVTTHHMPIAKDRQRFDSYWWKKGYSWGMHLANRTMLDDFVDRYKLAGLSRRRIHELLSCEGLSTQKIERIPIETGTCTEQHITYLEIDYSDWLEKNPLKQTAKRFRIVTERLVWGKPDPEVCQTFWYN